MDNTHLIVSRGIVLQVAIERTLDEERDGKSGVLFRTMTGRAIFLSYSQFQFLIPCKQSPQKSAVGGSNVVAGMTSA